VEEPAVPVSPFHHRSDAEAPGQRFRHFSSIQSLG
jgi:hypothetical protein